MHVRSVAGANHKDWHLFCKESLKSATRITSRRLLSDKIHIRYIAGAIYKGLYRQKVDSSGFFYA